ncbi:YggS family pyridoxal phosphate-dependent enzyme [Chitinophaga sp. Cy-1792]|uniref:YggS family pyridoxal phosphate-dependent enzyme n=1 Tax=Chitinophaga sp. Cy-1792 TaxID=2608339 RepID=UPI00141EAA2F|nr:YggS family pyridoxal phosphate-dependent enzyme [Chitinophaga sp. Cy-1792]NIG57636.1 YggS family pyridoxal phosphate-dependent enzyme [Chitinophaga sp. Cy-1792]
MAINLTTYNQVLQQLAPYNAKLVAVSKTKPVADIEALYQQGQRIFGENYVQELTEKQPVLPADIEWHFIGHLQSNKVKYIAGFVSMVHAVDSFKLLAEINKQAIKNNRVINCLLQLHIAEEETKFGLDEGELIQLLDSWQQQQQEFSGIRIAGLMAMATNTSNETQIRKEFHQLQEIFVKVKERYFASQDYFKERSTGMSADYQIALEEGSTMVRIGSLLFGERNYNK